MINNNNNNINNIVNYYNNNNLSKLPIKKSVSFASLHPFLQFNCDPSEHATG